MTYSAIEILFQVFARRWAHRWAKTFADGKARSLWRHDLQILGVTEANLREGLNRSARLEWPPSPAEFAALCRDAPEDHGLPSIERAYHAAEVMHWTHPAIYEAARRCGAATYNPHHAVKLAKSDFERAYSAVCREFMSGEWTPPATQKKRIERQPARPEVAQAHLAQMRAMFSRELAR